MNSSETQSTITDLIINVGRNVAIARGACNWKQADLAKLTGLGRSTIGKIESFNVSDISMSTILKLAEAFNIPAYILMLGPRDWANFVSITSLHDLVKDRKPHIDAEVIDRLEVMSRSENKKEQMEATAEIHQIADVIRGNVTSDSIEVSRSVATALSTNMLPKLPILNALIAEVVVNSYKNIFSKE